MWANKNVARKHTHSEIAKKKKKNTYWTGSSSSAPENAKTKQTFINQEGPPQLPNWYLPEMYLHEKTWYDKRDVINTLEQGSATSP